jgi:DNA-binding beta-propeller fold protein YncE
LRGSGPWAAVIAAFLLLYAQAAFAIWECGRVPLGETPGALMIDPVTKDIFVTTGTAAVIRVHEPTNETSRMTLWGPARSLAIDPARRILCAAHTPEGAVSLVNIDSGDTTVVATGGSPAALAVEPLRGLVCVCDTSGDRIVVIQGGAVVRTFSCNGGPQAVAVDPLTGHGFATLPEEDLIFEFDAAGTDTAYHAAGSRPAAIEIDPERGEIYVADSGGNSVTILDIDTGTESTVSLALSPAGLCLNPETRRLYSCGGTAVEILNTVTHSTLKVDLSGEPACLTVDALSDRAFATIPAAGVVAEITSSGDTLLISLDGAPSGSAFNPVTNKCYVADTAGEALWVLEAANYSGYDVPASGGPGPIALNLRNHKAYVPRFYNAATTVIDGTDESVSQFAVANGPNGVRVDPVTDDVYVVCAWSNMIVVKRSATGDTLHAPVNEYPHSISINSNTGRVYVPNRSSCDISIIDCQTLDTTMVRAGNYPCYVDVNWETNTIYVTNRTSYSLTVVDGATLATTYARVGAGPIHVKANPATNKIFAVDANDRALSVLDGVTLERTVVPLNVTPRAIAVNVGTNTIYVSNGFSGDITAVDGDTYEPRTGGGDAGAIKNIALDPWLNKVYGPSWNVNTLTILDCTSLKSLVVPMGQEPHAAQYDPVLEKLYVSNHGANSIRIISLRDKISPRITVAVDPLPGHVTYSETPTITGSAVSSRAPRNFGVMKVLYNVDNLRGEWSEAAIVGSGDSVSWQLTTPELLLGSHALFVTAVDSTAGSISSSSSSGLARVSDFTCYTFTRLSPPPEAPGHAIVERVPGTDDLYLAWDNTCGEGGWYEVEASSDPAFEENVKRLGIVREPEMTLYSDAGVPEGEYCRVTAVDYPHGKRSIAGDGFLLLPSGSAGDDGPPTSAVSLWVYPNPSYGPVNLRLVGDAAGEADCSIFDVTGQVVAELPVICGRDGTLATWDRTGGQGRQVSPGIYYVRVKTGSETLTRKIIVVR